ncbi:SDR family NAD(P)-dependent oxidoreductase [Sodalis sp. C49]|uniref:SDR family NAD(P)-dependent oxidoreductase n=1 Tax=unclassified Sodalis (in: enterobacteria) TaxID=2636512 RepID=UPI003965B21F
MMKPTDTHPVSDASGTAVITGASSGIGAVYARRLAERGYDLLLVARRGDRLSALAEELRSRYGHEARTLVADLAVAADLDRVAAILAADASITLLVNNAGTSLMVAAEQTPAPAVAALLNLNVTALTRLSLAVLPGFRARNRGTLINIGSVLGFSSIVGSAVYSGTKSFVLGFTQALQLEFADTNVRIQLVAPATTATEIWDISGVPLSTLDPDTIMQAGQCVDAALAGLDMGEAITLPSLEEAGLLADYTQARLKLFSKVNRGRPATRYHVTMTAAQ